MLDIINIKNKMMTQCLVAVIYSECIYNLSLLDLIQFSKATAKNKAKIVPIFTELTACGWRQIMKMGTQEYMICKRMINSLSKNKERVESRETETYLPQKEKKISGLKQ